MPLIELRPRSTSDIIDAAFTLYRRDPGQYLMLATLAALPGLLYSLAFVNQTLDTQTVGAALKPSTLLVTLLVGVVGYALSAGVTQRFGSRVLFDEPADIAQIVREVVPLIPKLIFATLLVGFATMLGTLLLIVPGIYVYCRSFAAVTVVALERKGATDAFQRAFDLSKNQAWHVFVTLALVFIIVIVLNMGVTMFATFISSFALRLVVSTAVGILIQPIMYLSILVMYYDLRIRNEGFDIEYLNMTLGGDSVSHA